MSDSPQGQAAIYILLVLSQGERHGYGIMKEVDEISQGGVRLGPATLYTTIKRLVQAGLIEEIGERKDPEMVRGEERRKYYTLSLAGKEVVTVELKRMEVLLSRFKSRFV